MDYTKFRNERSVWCGVYPRLPIESDTLKFICVLCLHHRRFHIFESKGSLLKNEWFLSINEPNNHDIYFYTSCFSFVFITAAGIRQVTSRIHNVLDVSFWFWFFTQWWVEGCLHHEINSQRVFLFVVVVFVCLCVF